MARGAGVSLATVDRVLHERPRVREKTVRRMQDAVRKLGYVRDLYAANLARQRQNSFVFPLPDGQDQILQAMRDAISEACAGLSTERVRAEDIRPSPARAGRSGRRTW